MSQSLACRDHLLHERNIREAAALHAQLRRLLARQHIASAKRLATEAPLSTSPSAAVASRLTRAVMAAHVDQVVILLLLLTSL